jgi:hypothetical protein
MKISEKQSMNKDIKNIDNAIQNIKDLASKYDSIKYDSNINILLNSLEQSKSILEDIFNENK